MENVVLKVIKDNQVTVKTDFWVKEENAVNQVNRESQADPE